MLRRALRTNRVNRRVISDRFIGVPPTIPSYTQTIPTPVVTQEKLKEEVKEDKENPLGIILEDLGKDLVKGMYFDVKTKAMGTIGQVNHSPTGNCQIVSISYFNTILDIYKYNKKNPVAILEAIYAKCPKTMILVDVNQRYTIDIKSWFTEEEIKLEAPYVNNTGSSMCIWLLQVQKMLNRITGKSELYGDDEDDDFIDIDEDDDF